MNTVTIHNFPKRLKVKELKKIIKDWPDYNNRGQPTEVWIETGSNKTSEVSEIWPLNKDENNADILFVSEAFMQKPKEVR